MRTMAAGIYRSNPGPVGRHQQIMRLRQEGFRQKEIAEKTYMSVTTVRYHLRGNCNCKNGRQAADVVAEASGAAQG